VGPLLGGFFSNSALHQWFSPHLPFLIAAGLAGFTFFLVVRTLPNKIDISVEKRSFVASMRVIAEHKKLRWLIACSFFVTLAIDAFYEFYPVLLVDRWSFSPAAISAATTALCVGMILAQAYLVPRTRVRPLTYLAAGLLYATALTAVAGCRLEGWIYPLFFLAGIGNAYLGVLLPAYISEITPKENQGSTMGVLVASRCLGDALVCLVMGGMASISIYLPILLAAASVLLGVVPFYRSIKLRYQFGS
jgi:MFS family permease